MSLWKNKKNGNTYEVLQEAIDCTNVRDGLEVYIYQPIDQRDKYFVREKTEFLEKFEQIQE